MSHWQVRSAVFLIAASAVLASCDSSGNEAKPRGQRGDGTTFNAQALRAEVPSASSLGSPNTVDPVFPDARMSRVCLAGAQVTIYEYRTNSDRKRVSETIDPHGSPIGNAYVDWRGPPRFYARGRVIALTMTDSRPVNEALAGVLGPVLTPQARNHREFSQIEACGGS